MEAFLLLGGVVAVPIVTQIIKSCIKTIKGIQGPGLKHGIRVIALGLSLSVAMLNSALYGVEIDPNMIQMFVDTLIVFIGSSGVYFFAKKAK